MTQPKALLSTGTRPALLRASVSAASRLPPKPNHTWLRAAVSASPSRARAAAASTGSGRAPRRQATMTAIAVATTSAKNPQLTGLSGFGGDHSWISRVSAGVTSLTRA